MAIWETIGYGISLLGISFILYIAIRTTIRYLKDKGILSTRKLSLKEWKKKENE